MAVGLLVEVRSNTILKPHTPKHQHVLTNNKPLYALPNSYVPLTIFDKASLNLHVAILFAFRSPIPDNDALIEGLSKVLLHYPHLTGRIVNENGSPCIVLNNAGIRLVETNFTTTTLDQNLPLVPSKKLSEFHPPIHGQIDELLQIQLNRFACGGLIVGVTSNHKVADGQSMSTFLVNWSKMVRGSTPDHLPFHNRDVVVSHRSPPHCEFDHRSIEFKPIPGSPLVSVDQVGLHFSSEFISKLKSKVTTRRCSTFQCLLSHVWKKLTRARGLGKNTLTQVKIAVNGRTRMRAPPNVSMNDYFGNLVLWAHPSMTVGDLQEKSYCHVADKIHVEVKRIDEDYFRSFVDFGEMAGDLVNDVPVGNSMCPDLEVDSWLGFGFHELDFGGGSPCGFVPPSLAVEGLIVFVPSCASKGGVDVFVGVKHEDVDLFKEISSKIED